MPVFGQGAGSAVQLGDEKIAAVLTYVRQDWGNKAGPVTTEEVAAVRSAVGNRDGDVRGGASSGEVGWRHPAGGPRFGLLGHRACRPNLVFYARAACLPEKLQLRENRERY